MWLERLLDVMYTYSTKRGRSIKPKPRKAIQSPTTSTKSPSSKSASPISLPGSKGSPSTHSLGPPVFFLGVWYLSDSPADFKKALTIAPHVVVERTVREISFWVFPDRRMILNLSPCDWDSASESEISWVPARSSAPGPGSCAGGVDGWWR